MIENNVASLQDNNIITDLYLLGNNTVVFINCIELYCCIITGEKASYVSLVLLYLLHALATRWCSHLH